MDIDSLIGQHFILGFQGHSLTDDAPIIEDIAQRNLGGIILFDKFLFKNKDLNNIRSPEQLRCLCSTLQAVAAHTLIISIDQEGGRVCRLHKKNGFPSMPSAEELGREKNCNGSRAVSQATGRLLADIGINCNFAPVADINITPTNPIIGALGRSFSKDPDIVTQHCLVWLESLHAHGVLGCLKHFPGHGSSTLDSHHGVVDISNSWKEIELLPYKKTINVNKAKAVMIGHLFLKQYDPDHPASLSKIIIQELLRDKLNFTGLVFTDDIQMRGITNKYGLPEAIVRALAAGVDLIIIGNNLEYDPHILEKAISSVKDALYKGILTEKALQISYQRIVNFKETFYEESTH